MASLPYYKQATDYTCGPACLRMLLAYHGINLEESEIAERAGTTPEGTKLEGIIKLLADLGLSAKAKTEATIDDVVSCLDNGIPVMVNYIEPTDEEGHYAIIHGYTETEFILHDPWNGENFTLGRSEFENRWYDHQSGELVSRWLLVVKPQDLPEIPAVK